MSRNTENRAERECRARQDVRTGENIHSAEQSFIFFTPSFSQRFGFLGTLRPYVTAMGFTEATCTSSVCGNVAFQRNIFKVVCASPWRLSRTHQPSAMVALTSSATTGADDGRGGYNT